MLSALAIASIRLYRATLSPLLGQNCRFHPTCSAYMEEAIRRHGAWRGTWLGLKRLSHCHPFHPGGYDPVDPGAPRADRSAIRRRRQAAA